MINKIDQIVMLASQAEDEEGTWVGKAGTFQRLYEYSRDCADHCRSGDYLFCC